MYTIAKLGGKDEKIILELFAKTPYNIIFHYYK